MLSRRILSIVSLVLFVVTSSGCVGSGTETGKIKPEQIIRYNLGAAPETLDPAKMTGLPEGTVENALFEGLVRYDAKNNIQPAMAENWTISKDRLVYTFKLRAARWSNGDPVTAEDFKFAWLRALNPDTASDYSYQLFYIKGAEAYTGKTGKAEDVAIKVLDPRTLQVTLAAPAKQFLGLTAFQTFFPLNKKVVEKHPDWYKSPEFFVSNGPFKFDKWDKNQRIAVVKNMNYWDAKSVRLDKLEFYSIQDNNTAYTMYQTGKLDFLEQPPSQEIPNLKGSPDYKIFPDTSVDFYALNVTKKPFNDPRVRKALAMAIDRQLIVERVAQAGQKPAFALVPYGVPDQGEADFRKVGGNRFYTENIAQARRLLADAGYPGGKGFPETTILLNPNELHGKIAQAIQQMWKKNLGIDVGLENKEWQVYLEDQQELAYDIARSGWTPDYLDPLSFIDMFVTKGGNNLTGWSNVKYDQLVQEAKSTTDDTVRMKDMHEAETILMNEMPIIPLFFYTNDDLIQPKVKNVVVPPFGVNAEFKWAYVE